MYTIDLYAACAVLVVLSGAVLFLACTAFLAAYKTGTLLISAIGRALVRCRLSGARMLPSNGLRQLGSTNRNGYSGVIVSKMLSSNRVFNRVR